MTTVPSYHKGDWVMFLRNCRPVIGEVLVVRKAARWPYEWELITTEGTVSGEFVVSRRCTEPVQEMT